jgi:hypothetical protein
VQRGHQVPLPLPEMRVNHVEFRILLLLLMQRYLPEFVFPLTFPVTYSSRFVLAHCFIYDLLR